MTTILIVLVEYTRRKEKHDFGVTFFLNVFWFSFLMQPFFLARLLQFV